jgi:thiol-disulfide isomerase/thioredoxin
VLLLVVLAPLLALLSAACGESSAVGRGDDAGSTGYVAGSGVVSVVPAAQRGNPVEFAGPLLDGGRWDLADQRGSVVVLNVWGSWCAPCRAEAPALNAAHERTATGLETPVTFVGVNTRDTAAGARGFVEEFAVAYPTVVDTDGRRLLAFRDTLPPAAIPTTLVLDPTGRVAARVLGEVSEATLVGLVEDVAAETT